MCPCFLPKRSNTRGRYYRYADGTRLYTLAEARALLIVGNLGSSYRTADLILRSFKKGGRSVGSARSHHYKHQSSKGWDAYMPKKNHILKYHSHRDKGTCLSAMREYRCMDIREKIKKKTISLTSCMRTITIKKYLTTHSE
jgi:hypothetical protein